VQVLLSAIESLPQSRVKVLLPVTDENNRFRFSVAVKVSEEAPHDGQNDKATVLHFY
jgi:hypothetical protein